MGTVWRTVQVRLSDEEMRDKARELSQALLDLEEAEQARKTAMAWHKDNIAGHRSEVSGLRDTVHNGMEPREVECREVFHHEALTVQVVRIDTGEIIHVRPMTDSERQLTMLDVEPEPEGGRDAG